jgi:hypothetical protein
MGYESWRDDATMVCLASCAMFVYVPGPFLFVFHHGNPLEDARPHEAQQQTVSNLKSSSR